MFGEFCDMTPTIFVFNLRKLLQSKRFLRKIIIEEKIIRKGRNFFTFTKLSVQQFLYFIGLFLSKCAISYLGTRIYSTCSIKLGLNLALINFPNLTLVYLSHFCTSTPVLVDSLFNEDNTSTEGVGWLPPLPRFVAVKPPILLILVLEDEYEFPSIPKKKVPQPFI